jgi:hypothetical protein
VDPTAVLETSSHTPRRPAASIVAGHHERLPASIIGAAKPAVRDLLPVGPAPVSFDWPTKLMR